MTYQITAITRENGNPVKRIEKIVENKDTSDSMDSDQANDDTQDEADQKGLAMS